jgi:small subunit ribosomal protein S20
MANHKSAKKRISVSAKRRTVNKASMSKMKTLVKKVETLSDASESSQNSYRDAVAYIDKMTAKGRIHKNNAARKKAQLTKRMNKLQPATA